jgi:tetracycline resistance efflux pump
MQTTIEPGWISLLPPVLAIALAIRTRQVYLSLAAGIFLGWTILEGWNPLAGLGRSIRETVNVFTAVDRTEVLLFTLVIGALIATVETFGGVKGFVRELEERNWVTTPRRARLLVFLTGCAIFIESNITVLVAGSVGRPLFDRFRVSREKLAYLVDATSAAVCILIPLNAWGAYVLGILGELGVRDPLGVFVGSIPLNFYALATVLMAGAVAVTGFDLGPMRRAEARTRDGQLLWEGATPMLDPEALAPEALRAEAKPRAVNMILPIATMIAAMPLFLYVTGSGDMREGSGSTSVLWAVLAGLGCAWVLLLLQRSATVDSLTKAGLRGAGGLVGLALVLLLALALADVARALGTGAYVAELVSGTLPPAVFLPLVFLVGAFVAFSTGTSWGTFAIMLPIAVPAAAALGLPLAPFVAASLSGGIFGDHASPISDTTIISSMAAATDHIDHVRTQIPYAMIAAAVATVGFALVGASL